MQSVPHKYPYLSTLNILHTRDIAPIINVNEQYLVPHTFMRSDSMLSQYLMDFDLVEKDGEDYIFYRCFVASNLKDAYEFAKQADSDFIYDKKMKSKITLSYTEGLGDK